ncbi:MAG: serine hydrolase domain-containing protein [Planctomycetota bacterium]
MSQGLVHGLYAALVGLLGLLGAPLPLVFALLFAYMAWLGLRPVAPRAGVEPLTLPGGASEEERIQAVDDWLEDLADAREFHGGVLIARAGVPLLMRTYGVADPTTGRPLATSTPFRLASVSRQFTAAAVLTLVRDGRLELDQEVAPLLPGLPYPGVTVRHLLDQTSGIPDRVQDLARKRRSALGGRLRVADVPRLLGEARLRGRRTPGARHADSGTDYVLAAAVVEAVSGTSFEAYLRKFLFEPLGMANSRVWTRESEDAFSERALDFALLPDGGRTALKPAWFECVAGDDGVFASLEDLLAWERFWREPRLVPAELVRECFRAPTLASGEASIHGFGWTLDPDGAQQSGARLGTRACVARGSSGASWLAVVECSSSLRALEVELNLRLLLRTLD